MRTKIILIEEATCYFFLLCSVAAQALPRAKEILTGENVKRTLEYFGSLNYQRLRNTLEGTFDLGDEEIKTFLDEFETHVNVLQELKNGLLAMKNGEDPEKSSGSSCTENIYLMCLNFSIKVQSPKNCSSCVLCSKRLQRPHNKQQQTFCYELQL